jgi:hypothetical protein
VDQQTFMVLTGSGLMDDGTPGDETTGTWVATFTSATDTFGWNASSDSSGNPVNPQTVPDSSSSLLLLGFGLTVLGGYGRFFKRDA